jgi:hypothetical protein
VATYVECAYAAAVESVHGGAFSEASSYLKNVYAAGAARVDGAESEAAASYLENVYSTAAPAHGSSGVGSSSTANVIVSAEVSDYLHCMYAHTVPRNGTGEAANARKADGDAAGTGDADGASETASMVVSREVSGYLQGCYDTARQERAAASYLKNTYAAAVERVCGGDGGVVVSKEVSRYLQYIHHTAYCTHYTPPSQGTCRDSTIPLGNRQAEVTLMQKLKRRLI